MTFKGQGRKSWLPGGNFHGFNELSSSPHGWLFMGWFHEGLANGYGEMALEESGIPEVHGTLWEWGIGLFPSQKTGGEGKVGRKLLVCDVTPVALGKGMISRQKLIPQKAGHLWWEWSKAESHHKPDRSTGIIQRTNGIIKGKIHGFAWNTIWGENTFIGRFAHGKKTRITVQAEDIVENSSSKTILKLFQRNQHRYLRGLCQAPAGCRGFEMETTQKFLKYSQKKTFSLFPQLWSWFSRLEEECCWILWKVIVGLSGSGHKR